jgi:hypothetical protein
VSAQRTYRYLRTGYKPSPPSPHPQKRGYVRNHQEETFGRGRETVPLTADEFAALATVEGKRTRKIRYEYPYRGIGAEIDVFQDHLAGLVVVDFEFSSPEEKELFSMPDFCLADITQEDFIAGGILCGKSYTDIQGELGRFGYQPLSV